MERSDGGVAGQEEFLSSWCLSGGMSESMCVSVNNRVHTDSLLDARG